jgi:hypothetical protein
MADTQFLDSLIGGTSKKKKSSSSPTDQLMSAMAARSQFDVPTSSTESFKKIMQSVGSVRKNTIGLEALNLTPKPPKREGFLSKLLGQEHGILTAPFRFVTALGADVLGVPFQDEEAKAALEKYSPLEAALRSAKGEFAITGGDVFKVKDTDSFTTRLAKYSGALAIDIVADPINWFGPEALIGRKAAAATVVREGEKLLPKAIEALAKEGVEGTAMVDKLFTNSKVFKLAEAGDPVLRERLGISGGQAIDAVAKEKIAGQQLANQIAEDLYIKGRPTVRKNLAELFGNDKAAESFMRALPADVSGGLFFKNPITGKAYGRVAGGAGKSILPLDALNKAREVAVVSAPSRFLSEHFAGRIGPTLAEFKNGIASGVESDIGRTTFSEFVKFKDIFRKANTDSSSMTKQSVELLSRLHNAKVALKTPEEQNLFEAAFKTHFFLPQSTVPVDASEAYKAGVDAAQTLRQAAKDSWQAQIDAGISVGNAGENWSPLRFTKEHAEYVQKEGFLSGGTAYNASGGRNEFVQYITDPEVAKSLGYSIPNADSIVALAAPEANKVTGLDKAGNKIFEEDPIKLMANYFDAANKTVSAKRFTNALEQAGVLYKLPADIEKTLVSKNAAIFISLASKTGEATRIKYDKLVADSKNKLKALIDQAEVTKTTVGERMAVATKSHDAAVIAEDLAKENLRKARATVELAQPRAAAIEADLRQYGQAGIEAAKEDAQREARNASSRASKARSNLSNAERDAAWAQTTGDQAIIDATQARAAGASDKAAVETLSSQTTRKQLRDAEEFRKSVADQLVGDRLKAYQDYETALSLQNRAATELEAAQVARRAASDNMRLAAKDTNITRAGAIDTVVNDWIEARTNFYKIRDSIGKAVKDMNDDELISYGAAKLAEAQAKKTMKEILGYATRKDSEAIGQKYAASVIKLANDLTVDQYKALKAISDADTLNAFAKQLEGVNLETHMNAIGDMYVTYRNIRKYINTEEIDNFAKETENVLAGKEKGIAFKIEDKGMDTLIKSGKRPPKAVEDLYNEAGLARVGSGPAKGNLRIPKSMQDEYASKGIRDVLEDIYKLHSSPSSWDKFIKDLYDPLYMLWKTGATVGRGPAFILNNIAGGMSNNLMGGVTVKEHLLSAKMIVELKNVTREITKANPNLGYFETIPLVEKELVKRLGTTKIGGVPVADLFSEFMDRGGFFSTDAFFQASEFERLGITAPKPFGKVTPFQAKYTTEPTGLGETGYRKVVSAFLDNRLQQMLNDGQQSAEMYLRFAAFVHGYDRYKNLDSAMDFMYMLHFDYADMNTAELWIKRLVPFYTWSRNNVPLQFRMAFVLNPQMRKLFAANEEFKQAFGVEGDKQWLNDYLPDYMNSAGGFVSYFKFGGNNLALFNKLPMTDVDKLFGTGYIGSVPFPLPRTSELVNMLGPSVKTPIELFTQRNFERGYKYESTSDLLTKQFENIFPYYNTAKKILSASGLPVERQKRISNLYGVLLGAPYGMSTYDEKTLANAARSKATDVSAQLKKAAAEAGIDVEWLRKQVADGKNLNQISALIASGQGDMASIARNKKLKELMNPKKETMDYRSILGSLQSGS